MKIRTHFCCVGSGSITPPPFPPANTAMMATFFTPYLVSFSEWQIEVCILAISWGMDVDVKHRALIPSSPSWLSLFTFVPCSSCAELINNPGQTLQRHNCENLKQIFPEKELDGLSPNIHIHVSVSDLYITTIRFPYSCSCREEWLKTPIKNCF